MLALYGHPFSSYTWKALIPLYAESIRFDFRMVDSDHPENTTIVQRASPQGKFPVLADGDRLIFEATTIIEHLAVFHGGRRLLPDDPGASVEARMVDRVFDNYVMTPMQLIVDEYLRNPASPDMARVEQIRKRLTRSYAWIESWLLTYPAPPHVTLIECAAAPSLFYADWVHPVADEFSRLRRWRAHLLALPPVKRCVDDARPYRTFFPLGAPDKD